MSKIVVFLTPGYADWEAALVCATTRSFYGCEIITTSTDGAVVQSAGGFTVTPDAQLTPELVTSSDALILVGGAAWRGSPPEVNKAIIAAQEDGKVLAAICDATRALAGAGVLNDVAHTSNDTDTLGVPGYDGSAHYVEQPQALRSGNVITAAGTAPTSFMAEVVRALGFGDANLDFYLGMLGAEHNIAATGAPRAD